ncbi:hypothetical protein [Mesorhizobium sp. M1374]|uniref:hypothetical protein n=1 Tax=Mesorhizobium sp. M1374 TaxID=2957091 RepID=UPI00333950CD
MIRTMYPNRRTVVLGGIFGAATAVGFIKDSFAAEDPALVSRFKDLSEDGNSTCSGKFTESIATMPSTSRIKSSCCSPMDVMSSRSMAWSNTATSR